MVYEAKKLFNGYASVRDYVVKKSVQRGEDLTIWYQGEKMVVPFERLKRPLDITKREQKSKFNGKSYHLYDFKWIPDELKVVTHVNEQPTLFALASN